MQQSCPHCDDPDISLLRLVLIGEIPRADEMRLLLLADMWQESGLLVVTEDPRLPSDPRRADCVRCDHRETSRSAYSS